MFRELMSLILAFSSFFIGVKGGGEAEYSWRAMAPHGAGVQASAQQTAPEKMPAVGRVPERVPGVARPNVDAESVLALEAESGKVLYARGSDTVRPLASLTKLMTALTALDYIKNLDAPVTITRDDNARGGRTYVYPGEVFTADDLLHLSLVSSANDATHALARATGLPRSAFVAAMNDKARSLRLVRSRFADPTGLSPENVSTAEEVARLLHSALSHPVLAPILAVKEYHFTTVDGRRSGAVQSTNRLLGATPFAIVGAKTGYIDESGYNFTMQAAGASGEMLTIVLLGAPSEDARFSIAKTLVAWADKAWQF